MGPGRTFLSNFLIVTVALLLSTQKLSAEVSADIDRQHACFNQSQTRSSQQANKGPCHAAAAAGGDVGGYWSLIIGVLALVSFVVLMLNGGTLGDLLVAVCIIAVLLYFDRTLTLIAYLFSIYILSVCLLLLVEVWFEGVLLGADRFAGNDDSSSESPPATPPPTRKQVSRKNRSARNNEDAIPGIEGAKMGILLRVALEPKKKAGWLG